jgi:autotransporter translocation and assembly factor TamB
MRAIGKAFLVLVCLVAALLFALLVFLRTESGRTTVLDLALPRIQNALAGKIRIGSISGDLFGNLEIHDIAIDDPESRPAIRVRKLVLRYSLLRVLQSARRIDEVRVEDGWVAVTRLSKLGKPATQAAAGKPFDLSLSRVVVDALVEAPPRTEQARVHAEGSLHLADTVDTQIDQLRAVWEPGAWLTANGKARIDGVHSVLSQVALTARIDLGKLPLEGARGLVDAYAEADGPLHALLARLRIKPRQGQIDATARIDLSRVTPSGRVAVRADAVDPWALWPRLPRGRLWLDVTLEREPRTLSIAGTGRVRGLALPGVAVEQVDLQMHTVNFEGSLALAARRSRIGQVALDLLTLRAEGDPKHLRLDVDSQGPARTRVVLRAHGAPRREGKRWVGADLSIDALRLARNGVVWRSTRAASVAIGDQVTLSGLALASGLQRLALDGSYRFADREVKATLQGDRLDAERLASLLAEDRHVPRTDLTLHVDAGGRLPLPRVDLTLSGWAYPPERYPHTQLRVEAHLAERTLKGEVTATAAGNALYARATLPFDARARAPLDGDAHLVLTLDRSTRQLWNDLVPQARSLVASFDDTRADLTISARGTYANPELEAHLVGTARSANAISGRSRLDLTYRDGRLGARLFARAVTDEKKRLGTLEAEAEAPIRLSLEQRRPRVAGLQQASVTGAVLLTGVDLALLRTVGVSLPADGKLDVRLLAGYAHGQLSADAEGLLDGLTFIRASGQAPLSSRPWRSIPATITAKIPAFPLSKVPRLAQGLSGELSGELRWTGSVDDPNASAELRATKLRFGASDFAQLDVSGTYDGKRVTGRAQALQGTRTALDLRVSLPLAADQPLALDARFDQLLIDLRSDDLPVVRRVRAVLDGEAHAKGTRAQPTLSGRLAVRDGVLGLTATSMEYRNVTLAASLRDQKIVLDQLLVHAGDGNARMYGNAVLEGLTLRTAELHVISQKFPISMNGLSGWLDTQVDAYANRDAGGTRVRLQIRDGTLKLPKISSRRSLQSTGPLKDVVFVDAPPDKKLPKVAQALTVEARAPGPFRLRSPEGAIDLGAILRLAPADQKITLWGSLSGLGGWIELFGRRYQVERLRIGFDGSPDFDPQLDIRLTRQVADAVIALEVYGSMRRPKLAFTSDPPVYGEAQVIGLIVSGDAGNQQVSERSLDQQAIGALSGLLVGRIKDELAPQLPLDVIKVDAGPTGTTRLEAGKFITDSIYVGYVLQLGGGQVTPRPINRNEAQVDYRFLRNYHLESRFGDAGAGSIDLYWSKRF